MTRRAVFHDSGNFDDGVGTITMGGDMATDSLWGAKGDLAVGTANDLATRVAVGTADGMVLTVQAAAAAGVAWLSPGSGSPTGAAGGALDGTYPNPGLGSAVAGAGLSETSDVLSVNVDGATLEISSDALRVKDGGLGTAKLSFDVATQAELDAHTGDTTDAHDASAISIADTGGYFTGSEVEAALQELGAGLGGGGITKYFRVRRAANQSCNSGVFTVISFDTEDADTDTMFSATSTDVTIKTAGLWHFELYLNVASPGASKAGIARILKGGVGQQEAGPFFSTTGAYDLRCTTGALMVCAVNDVITASVFHDSGSAKNVTGVLAGYRVAA